MLTLYDYRGGLGGRLPPPGNLEMKGETRKILLLFIVNKKPDVTYNLIHSPHYNKR